VSMPESEREAEIAPEDVVYESKSARRRAAWRALGLKRLTVLVIAAAVLVYTVVMVAVRLWPDSAETAAIRSCELAVVRQLEAPATAEFGDATADAQEGGGYLITGQVDVENGFGGLIRDNNVCAAVPVGDSWFALAVLM